MALQIEYAENWLGIPRPPLAWSVERDGVPLASRENAGGDPEHWAWLCEDTEASVGPKGPNSVQRHQLRECVRWASLWGDAAEVPARDAQLRDLAAEGFGAFVPDRRAAPDYAAGATATRPRGQIPGVAHPQRGHRPSSESATRRTEKPRRSIGRVPQPGQRVSSSASPGTFPA